MKIKPTIGRVVWFWPATQSQDPSITLVRGDPPQPFAAMVAYAWSDSMINISFIDHAGKQHQKTSIKLLQADEPKPETGFYCEWMPFQIGQAKVAK